MKALVVFTLFSFLILPDSDIYRLSLRRNYYPPAIARLFQNKLTVSFVKTRIQLFSFLKL